MKRPWFTHLPAPLVAPAARLSMKVKNVYEVYQYQKVVSLERHQEETQKAANFLGSFSSFLDDLAPDAFAKLRLTKEQGRYLRGFTQAAFSSMNFVKFLHEPEPAFVCHYHSSPSPIVMVDRQNFVLALNGSLEHQIRIDEEIEAAKADRPLPTCGGIGWYPNSSYPERMTLHKPQLNFLILPDRPETDDGLVKLLRGQYPSFENKRVLANGERIVFSGIINSVAKTEELALRFSFLGAYQAGDPEQTYHIYGANLASDFDNVEKAKVWFADFAHQHE